MSVDSEVVAMATWSIILRFAGLTSSSNVLIGIGCVPTSECTLVYMMSIYAYISSEKKIIPSANEALIKH